MKVAPRALLALCALLLAGCGLRPAAEPPTFPTPGDAAVASGLDPSAVMSFDDHAVAVYRDADASVGFSVWQLGERGWTFAGGSSTTRIGPLADAVIMGGPVDAGWQVGYIYGFLPRGVASVESAEIPGGYFTASASGGYVLVLGDISDPRLQDPQSIKWRMRDRVGHVLREGMGDCCPKLD